MCVYVGTHESASSIEDDSRRCGRPPVAPASRSPVIAVISRVISRRLMNITAAAITCEKVNSRTSASINYSLSGRCPGTQHLTPRPSHQGGGRRRKSQRWSLDTWVYIILYVSCSLSLPAFLHNVYYLFVVPLQPLLTAHTELYCLTYTSVCACSLKKH